MAVLAVCGLALVADRVFLLPPAAEAEEPEGNDVVHHPVVVHDPVMATAPEADPGPAPQGELATRLVALAGERGLRAGESADALQPPLDWVVIDPGDPGSPTELFVSTHRLGGTFVGDRSHAIIDGQRLSPGEEIDGFVLISVGERSALFERDGIEVELTLDVQQPSENGAGSNSKS